MLERFTERILKRQRAMYEAPTVPFIDKWRKAMNYIDEDLASGYPKIWYELQALAWNRPEFRSSGFARPRAVGNRPQQRNRARPQSIRYRSKEISAGGDRHARANVQLGIVTRATHWLRQRTRLAPKNDRSTLATFGEGTLPVRACEPTQTGVVVREGVRIAYSVYGNGEPSVLLLPAWSIVHSRMWKGQIPYLARHVRVVTFDGRGNGLSDKSPSLDYSDEAFAADALAVLDATGTARATLVGLSGGARWAVLLAARYPGRVERLICIGAAVPTAPRDPDFVAALSEFDRRLDSDEGWWKFNRHYWRAHYREFLEFFFGEALPEPHSTKPFEDCVGWGLETTPETLAATALARRASAREFRELLEAVHCPVSVIHGEDDRIVPAAAGRALADATHGRFVLLPRSGHLPQARHPVRINVEIRDAIEPRSAPTKRSRRRKRALFISSPIGLGHAQRDVAIAAELRKLRPDVDVEWLAQHPVTEVLQASGETIHPASAALVNESSHIESECAEHDLHAFAAIRNMDEILVNNFMVFYDLIRDGRYDLVVGDEAWDVDYFLHENPREKRTAFVWMTDFVGWIPMPDGGDYERRITADYNADMIEHIARSPQVRDRSIFVGDPEDIVPSTSGRTCREFANGLGRIMTFQVTLRGSYRRPRTSAR